MQTANGTLDQAVGGVNRSAYSNRPTSVPNGTGSVSGVIQAGGQQPSRDSFNIQRASYQQPLPPVDLQQNYGQQPGYGQPFSYGAPISGYPPITGNYGLPTGNNLPPTGGYAPDPWIASAAGMYQSPAGYMPESAPACDNPTTIMLDPNCGNLSGI